jgi:hypothetical protein
MNPEQNQYPVDYLNQIAPKQTKPTMNPKVLMGLIAGVILIAVIALFALSSGGQGPVQKMQTLAARLQTLQTISSKAQKNIKSGDLRSINSNLTIYLTNTNRDIAEPLSKNNVDIKKLDKTIVTAEKGEELSKKLEDARLNATFDRVYTREMTYQLDTLAGLMQEIYGSTNSKSLKDFLVTTDENLQPIKKQLSEFNATTG